MAFCVNNSDSCSRLHFGANVEDTYRLVRVACPQAALNVSVSMAAGLGHQEKYPGLFHDLLYLARFSAISV
jgi:phosphoheptose isomerase